MTDREIFLKARERTIRAYQEIVFYEWLPAMLGPETIQKHNLGDFSKESGYSPTTDARVANEFASVAFRFGHSQVTDVLHRFDKNMKRSKYGHLNLRDNYFSPGRVLKQGGIDPIIRGMLSIACQQVDTKAMDSVRNFLFGTNTKGFDLVAINIQRGRDHGMPDYNTMRDGLGLIKRGTFEDVTSNREVSSILKEL